MPAGIKNKKNVVTVLVTIFLMASVACLASTEIAQASSDAVLILHLDEGSGAIAEDDSSYGNDGTIYGATWRTGISGTGLYFDGTHDYVDCGNDRSLNIADEFTIEAWIYPYGWGEEDRGVIVSKNENIDYSLYITDWRDCLGIQFDDEGYFSDIDVIKLNKWQHIAVTFDENLARDQIKFFVNGDICGTETRTRPIPTSSYDLIIGNWEDRTRTFDGTIDEIGIYNRALSSEEIEDQYLAEKAGGSTKETVSELIGSVSSSIDDLKNSNVDTTLIEGTLDNAQHEYDNGDYDEAYELAQNAQELVDDAYEAQQAIESAQAEIADAKTLGADVKEAEDKLAEAEDALNKGNYEYAQNWANKTAELAKNADTGSVQINDLKALATKYDGRTVVVSGTLKDIETAYGKGYTFALDDGSGMISVTYQGNLGDLEDGDKVKVTGVFQASTGTIVAEDVQKLGLGGVSRLGVLIAIVVVLAIAIIVAVLYILRRRE